MSQQIITENEWTPAQFSGCQGWFSTDLMDVDGGEVHAMPNGASVGGSALAVEASRRPTFELAGDARWVRATGSLEVGGTYHYLRSTDAPIVAGLHSSFYVAAVVQPMVSNGNGTLLHISDGATNNYVRIFSPKTTDNLSQILINDGTTVDYLYNAADDGADPDASDTDVHLLEFWYDGTSLSREYDASGTVRTDADVTAVSMTAHDQLQLFVGASGGAFGANIRTNSLAVFAAMPDAGIRADIQTQMMRRVNL